MKEYDSLQYIYYGSKNARIQSKFNIVNFWKKILRVITGVKAILNHIINLGSQVLFHLITLELLDEGADIILSIIIILTSRPLVLRIMPQRYIGQHSLFTH